jgi:hypothetical protein
MKGDLGMTTSLATEEPLDMRSIPVGERPSNVLAAFDKLAPGNTLVITAGDAGDLLRYLQAERRGRSFASRPRVGASRHGVRHGSAQVPALESAPIAADSLRGARR